jgi:hypothetical protein
VCPVKPEQHGAPKAVRAILRHNKRLIRWGQRPRFGSVTVIGHCSDSMREFVAKLLSFATNSESRRRLMFSGCKSLSRK